MEVIEVKGQIGAVLEPYHLVNIALEEPVVVEGHVPDGYKRFDEPVRRPPAAEETVPLQADIGNAEGGGLVPPKGNGQFLVLAEGVVDQFQASGEGLGAVPDQNATRHALGELAVADRCIVSILNHTPTAPQEYRILEDNVQRSIHLNPVVIITEKGTCIGGVLYQCVRHMDIGPEMDGEGVLGVFDGYMIDPADGPGPEDDAEPLSCGGVLGRGQELHLIALGSVQDESSINEYPKRRAELSDLYLASCLELHGNPVIDVYIVAHRIAVRGEHRILGDVSRDHSRSGHRFNTTCGDQSGPQADRDHQDGYQ